jgi:signal transduction histidine kinase
MAEDDRGIVWLSFANNLVRWDGSSYQKFSFPLGRLDISVATMAVRGNHVWLAGSGGIVLFSEGRFSLMQFVDPQLPGRVSGIVETEKGELWTNGFSGITHVSAFELARWVHDPTSKVQGERLNAFDGLPGLSAERFPEPSLIEASDGKMWFATTQGVAWLDPEALSKIRNPVPPPMYVTSIVVNGKTFPASSEIRLPKLTQNLAITYTALSLAVPERVQFRYRLDGVDKDWQESGGRRESFYTKLSPGNYKLAIIAWAIRHRMHVVAQNIRARLAERLDERERIARELHDTLLQGVLSASIQLDLAEEELAADSPVRSLVQRVLETLRQVTEEGRMALRGLRFQEVENGDLAKAFLRVKKEYPHKDTIVFRVITQGATRVVRTEIRNEVFRIGREAIVNAYVHSEAATIEVEILYARTHLSLLVRDDGRGADSSILQGGRDGHWGLSGMRERSQRIGATLKLRSKPGAGTEIELVVPGHIAFEDDSGDSTPQWLSWLGREGSSGLNSTTTKARGTRDES